MKKKGIGRFFNLFDVIAIAVILALAAVLVLVGRGLGGDGESMEITYVVEIPSIQESMAGLISPGDALVDRIKKYDVGTIESVELSTARVLVNDQINGGASYVEVPDECEAVITIKAPAVVTDTEITVDKGYVIRVGSSVVLKGPGYQISGTIIALNREELE